MMAFRERVISRLKELGLKKTDLAERSGYTYSYICKLLMAGRGNRENPSPTVKRSIAGALGLLPGELDEVLSLSELLIRKLHDLPKRELAAIHHMQGFERFALVLELMQGDPRWSDLNVAAQALGLPLETIRVILDGTNPDAPVVKELEARTQLTSRFWMRGKLDPDPALIQEIQNHDDAQGYLEAVDIAIKAEIPSETVKGVVSAIANGGAK